jgi:hypothetical protein
VDQPLDHMIPLGCLRPPDWAELVRTWPRPFAAEWRALVESLLDNGFTEGRAMELAALRMLAYREDLPRA